MKTLFAHSRNLCFYERCENRLTDPAWTNKVNGEVAHIRGESPGSARYDADQPDSERQGFNNLMLLCPNCHKRIDYLEPTQHRVERLHEMKERHIQHESAEPWCTEAQAADFAADVLAALRLHSTTWMVSNDASAHGETIRSGTAVPDVTLQGDTSAMGLSSAAGAVSTNPPVTD